MGLGYRVTEGSLFLFIVLTKDTIPDTKPENITRVSSTETKYELHLEKILKF